MHLPLCCKSLVVAKTTRSYCNYRSRRATSNQVAMQASVVTAHSSMNVTVYMPSAVFGKNPGKFVASCGSNNEKTTPTLITAPIKAGHSVCMASLRMVAAGSFWCCDWFIRYSLEVSSALACKVCCPVNGCNLPTRRHLLVSGTR